MGGHVAWPRHSCEKKQQTLTLTTSSGLTTIAAVTEAPVAGDQPLSHTGLLSAPHQAFTVCAPRRSRLACAGWRLTAHCQAVCVCKAEHGACMLPGAGSIESCCSICCRLPCGDDPQPSSSAQPLVCNRSKQNRIHQQQIPQQLQAGRSTTGRRRGGQVHTCTSATSTTTLEGETQATEISARLLRHCVQRGVPGRLQARFQEL